MNRDVPRPTRPQYRAARAVAAWYIRHYYGGAWDVGVPHMFCRKDLVGSFAVNAGALAAGESRALFKLLVTMTMFQRRSDQQIMRVLRGIPRASALEMTNPRTLLRLAHQVDCPHASHQQSLKTECDLSKDPATKRGTCGKQPSTPCHLKRHTELLKRYGHFGKVPTSAALTVRATGARSLAALKDRVWREHENPNDRALALERAISGAWRVSEKISAMFLSAVTNRDLSGDLAPWADGVNSSHFVVIDSNVDLFLAAIDYKGTLTYRARKAFVQALARRVRLDELHPDLQPYNPRLVQQALYMFMSESNRRVNAGDCSNSTPPVCAACPQPVRALCTRHPNDVAPPP